MTIDQEIRKYPFSESPGIDIDPTYGLLRSTEPLARVQLPYGEVCWLATRYEDVKTVLTDPRFSRAAAQGQDQPRLREEMTYEGITRVSTRRTTPGCCKLAGKALTCPPVQTGFGEDAQRIANEYLERHGRQGFPGDLVEMFALPFPITGDLRAARRPVRGPRPVPDLDRGADQHQRAAHGLCRAVVRLHGQPRRPAP